MIFFAVIEIIPYLKEIKFDSSKLYLGGILSGFFGGLSGHQGAFRSTFLLKVGLTKETFIATGVVIACLVDFTRLSIYFSRFFTIGITDKGRYLAAAIISAFTGAYLGKKLLKKITLESVQILVSGLIIILALLLGAGII